jgi:DNA mismatch repair protein MutS2
VVPRLSRSQREGDAGAGRAHLVVNSHSLEVLEFEKVRRMILRWTFSPLGRELAQALAPGLSDGEIRVSQERIAEWKRLELRGEAPSAGELEDLRPTFVLLRRGTGVLDALELFRFLPFLEHVETLRRLREQAEHRVESFPRLEEILSAVENYSHLRDRLRRSVAASGEILDTASPELARIRGELLASQQRASSMLDEICGRLSEGREDTFVTLREGRFVISVRSQHRGHLPGLVHGRSASGQSVLVEPLEAVETNNRVAEARDDEKLEEARVLRELTELLRERADSFSRAFQAAGLCDLIRAEAKLALTLRAEAPALNTGSILRIVQGRHPILAEAEDRGGNTVVPLDLELHPDKPVLLISGPNMGGKSVALKTIGLLTLMARAGLHVPAADGTDLPLADQVFVDLGDEQSIEGDLSTFAGHLRNVGLLWQEAGPHSLVLLDELGGGTDPEEGAALAMAVLEGLQERECLTVATTHLTAVKLFAGGQPGMRNASMEFDTATLTPRYRLKLGELGRSRAFEIARSIYPKLELWERAERFRSPLLLQMDRLMGEIDTERAKLESERRGVEEERRHLESAAQVREKQAGRLRERLDRVRQDREGALGRLYREAEEYLQGMRAELEAKAKEKPPSAALPDVRGAEREVARRSAAVRRRKPAPRGRRLDPSHARPGGLAWLPDLSAMVRIERMAEGKAWVDWQGRRLEVPLEALEEMPESVRGIRPPAPISVRIEEPEGEPIGRELDLRGCRAEEALDKLDRFLDRATMQNLHQVRIVHGKGTGALKREVEKHLKTHPLVSGFRLGELNEGGWGVTVADLGSNGE